MSGAPGRLYVALDERLAPGQRLAQCAHAVAAAHAAMPAACHRWREGSNAVVVLAVPPGRLADLAARRGAAAFREPDLGGELTAVALFPEDDATRRALRRERLAS